MSSTWLFLPISFFFDHFSCCVLSCRPGGKSSVEWIPREVTIATLLKDKLNDIDAPEEPKLPKEAEASVHALPKDAQLEVTGTSPSRFLMHLSVLGAAGKRRKRSGCRWGD
jgi:hypothetical protein